MGTMHATFLFLLPLILVGAEEIHKQEVLSRASFPKDFIFGSASSAYQVEGGPNQNGRGPSIWDEFIKTPGRITNNDKPDVAVDEYHRYKEDIDLMAELNFDAYRFSISWSRIFPKGRGKINPQGVQYYSDLIDYLLLKGIQPVANLHHYDLPQALEEEMGGWLNKSIVDIYAHYADFCFNTYGNRVRYWTTFNEPRAFAVTGYDAGICAPGRCSAPFGNCSAGNSSTEPYIAGHSILLSHAKTVDIYRKKYQSSQNGSIGILLDFVWFEPLTNSTEDEAAASRARDFNIGWYLEPILYGAYPKSMVENVGSRLPKFTPKEANLVKGSYDFIGVNHYTSFYAAHSSRSSSSPADYSQDWGADTLFERDGVPIGEKAHSYWLYIVPWGMYKALTYIKEHYGNPKMMVTENGMDQPANLTYAESLNDIVRLNYYQDYIANVAAAIRDGANVHGYFAWTMLDNYEWLSGYTSRFGIVYVDYKHNLKRTPKLSARWFMNMLAR